MPALTKDQLRALRADIDAALAPIAAKHQLSSLQAGRCTYTTSGNFTMKVEGVATGGLNKIAADYEGSRQWDKTLPPLGAEFIYGGEEYKIAGCKSRSGKIIATRTRDKKDYVFPRDAVVRLCTVGA
jgi:hypothetical protein